MMYGQSNSSQETDKKQQGATKDMEIEMPIVMVDGQLSSSFALGIHIRRNIAIFSRTIGYRSFLQRCARENGT